MSHRESPDGAPTRLQRPDDAAVPAARFVHPSSGEPQRSDGDRRDGYPPPRWEKRPCNSRQWIVKREGSGRCPQSGLTLPHQKSGLTLPHQNSGLTPPHLDSGITPPHLDSMEGTVGLVKRICARKRRKERRKKREYWELGRNCL